MLIGIFDQLGAQTDRLRCEVCQNLILSPMNTGFLRYTVATVLTVYGIETNEQEDRENDARFRLQQCLPFTVLKHHNCCCYCYHCYWLQQCLPFTVLKHVVIDISIFIGVLYVATVLTVYGIETHTC